MQRFKSVQCIIQDKKNCVLLENIRKLIKPICFIDNLFDCLEVNEDETYDYVIKYLIT